MNKDDIELPPLPPIRVMTGLYGALKRMGDLCQ